MASHNTLEDIFECLEKDVTGNHTSVGSVVASFERRGFGPLLLVPSLFLVLPTGAIPGVPLVCGIIIILITVQIMLGFTHPWIPKRLKAITFDSSALVKGLRKTKPFAKKIDRYTGSRFTWLITPVSKWLVALICTALAILIIPLGTIPFAIFLPALAIVFFALGFSVNDGLIIAMGLFIAGLSAMGSVLWWL